MQSLQQPTAARPAFGLLRGEFEADVLDICTLEAPDLLPRGGAFFHAYSTMPGGFIAHVQLRPGVYS